MEAGGKKRSHSSHNFTCATAKNKNKQKNASTDVLCKYVDALCT